MGFETVEEEIYRLGPGSCTKVNCRIKFGLAGPRVGRPAQVFSYNSLSVYNSLSAAIHLYMIRAIVLFLFQIEVNIIFQRKKTSPIDTITYHYLRNHLSLFHISIDLVISYLKTFLYLKVKKKIFKLISLQKHCISYICDPIRFDEIY